jgi:hypothetical protein
MKKTLFALFLFATLTAVSQQTVIRRITTTTGTIPASDTVQGLVKIDSSYSSTYKYLRYIGTTNIANVFQSGAVGANGWMWIYVPSATSNYFARVISVAAVGDAALDTFRIQVDRVMVFTASAGFKSITNKLYGYSFQNDGGDTATANDVDILNLETVSMTQSDISGTSNTPYQEPIKIVATTTSILIIERKGK